MTPARPSRSRSALVAGVVALCTLAGCAESPPAAQPQQDKPPYEVLVMKPELMPVERRLDGTIEAVNQGTVSAQTAGRIVAIEYDVNDFVPAGAVILRLRATEQRAGLSQAQAAVTEATNQLTPLLAIAGAAARPVRRAGHAARGGAADRRDVRERLRAVPGRERRRSRSLVASPMEQVLGEISGVKHLYSVSRPASPC
jgi:multidrug efflux pump subunit AcrA (membrane-fusion protein)